MRLLPRPQTDHGKRYSFYRVYEDCVGHKKWLLVSKRTGVELPRVHTIIFAMLQAASKERADGYIGSFDFEEVECLTGVPAHEVAAVHRVLNDMGWIAHGVVASWAARNPRDKTATDRQRNKRQRDNAVRAVASGYATPDQRELLSVEDRERLDRLAAMSRVTATPPAPPPPERIAAFILVRPKEDTYPAREAARQENEREARRWLVGDASSPAGYGPASKIVADNFGCNRMSADSAIRRWLTEDMAGDVVALATIISGAAEQALNGEHFRNVVEQRMAEVVKERTRGPQLELGMVPIKGGRAG